MATYHHEFLGHAVCKVFHPLQTQFTGIVRSVCFGHKFQAAQSIDLANRIIVHVKTQYHGNGERSESGRKFYQKAADAR
jgi:hypothetical protein